MTARWVDLSENERAAFHAVNAFLQGRLKERATIDWALKLSPNDAVQRLALLEQIDSLEGRKIGEPWRTAWRLIEESWNQPQVDPHASVEAYHIRDRLTQGERTGSLVTAIVQLVAPRLKIKPFSNLDLSFRKPPKRPKKVEDLFSVGLTSGEIVDPDELTLGTLTDRAFLVSLAHALDAAVASGLDIARLMGWYESRQTWRMGMLHRVHYAPVGERVAGEHEPDSFHEGIAPSVKLLHSVVQRLADIDISEAVAHVRRWKLANMAIHARLWAALSQDRRITPANEASDWLLALDQERFWDLHDYPEIAELRAKRFGEFEPEKQAAITTRIRKRPPRNHWPREADTDQVEKGRFYWAIRELRRIELAGATLPERDNTWLDARIHEFPDLVRMARLDNGFLTSPKAQWVEPNPDDRYDFLSGEERLKALESALSSTRGGWDDNPSGRAFDWIKQPGNFIKLLADLESVPDGGAAYSKVWEKIGRTHAPDVRTEENAAQRDLPMESARVLTLLAKLPPSTLRPAIDGLTHWLVDWAKHIVSLPETLKAWLKLWPIAVEATNAREPVEEKDLLNTFARSSNTEEPMDLDTLNTPAGRLVGVFLAACPTVSSGDQPFLGDSSYRSMRNEIEATLSGASGLIVKYRLIEHMRYFLLADRRWTLEKLVPPLRADNAEARTLWRAVGRQQPSFEVMEILGEAMADRAVDPLIGRETRRNFVFNVLIECLHAFKDHRQPAVPHSKIQQMLRLLDDEARAYGAKAVLRFVEDLSASSEGGEQAPSPEELFRSAAAPFLRQVWPQERSLSTTGVSRALARLPAATGDAFAEAVDVIERFLVPFDCWSMVDFGLFGDKEGKPKLAGIDNPVKADALLRLLDAAVGTAEGCVIPYDLADALDQIRASAPKLAEDPRFRRLATSARRG